MFDSFIMTILFGIFSSCNCMVLYAKSSSTINESPTTAIEVPNDALISELYKAVWELIKHQYPFITTNDIRLSHSGQPLSFNNQNDSPLADLGLCSEALIEYEIKSDTFAVSIKNEKYSISKELLIGPFTMGTANVLTSIKQTIYQNAQLLGLSNASSTHLPIYFKLIRKDMLSTFMIDTELSSRRAHNHIKMVAGNTILVDKAGYKCNDANAVIPKVCELGVSLANNIRKSYAEIVGDVTLEQLYQLQHKYLGPGGAILSALKMDWRTVWFYDFAPKEDLSDCLEVEVVVPVGTTILFLPTVRIR